MRLSNSTVKTFLACRRKYWLTYYRRLAPRPETRSAVGVALLGTRIHTALEAWYEHRVPVLKALEALYADAQERSPHEYGELTKEHSYARLMASGYLEWAAAEGIDERYEVVSAEKVLTVPLPGTGVELLAKLDQVVLDHGSGALRIRDYKTVGSFAKVEGLARDQQMRFYDLALSLSTTQRVDGALYTMILRSKRTAKATGPFFAQEEVTYNGHDRESMALRVAEAASQIAEFHARMDAGADHRAAALPSPNGECDWACHFARVCPMFDDGSNVEGALSAFFVEQDPYAYYGNDLVNKVLERTGAGPSVVG